jgi:homoserine acetyltransferase
LPGTAPRLVDPLYRYPGEGVPYYSDFPLITIRDMVRAHILLRKHLGIGKIHLLMGGSMGGYQALEWSVMEREVIGQLFLIATSPAESAWGIAFILRSGWLLRRTAVSGITVRMRGAGV